MWNILYLIFVKGFFCPKRVVTNRLRTITAGELFFFGNNQ